MASKPTKKHRYQMRRVNVGRFEPREVLPGASADGAWEVTGFGIPHHFVQLEIRTKRFLRWSRWERVQIGARVEPSGDNPW